MKIDLDGASISCSEVLGKLRCPSTAKRQRSRRQVLRVVTILSAAAVKVWWVRYVEPPASKFWGKAMGLHMQHSFLACLPQPFRDVNVDIPSYT